MVDEPMSRFDALRRVRSHSRRTAEAAALAARRTRVTARAQDQGEMVVRSLGVVLAIASTAFAAYMISDAERRPQFAGLEHLSIFSRPTIVAAHRAQTQIASDQQSKVDYTPVGSISESTRDQSVPGFVLLGVRSGAAVIQTPNTIIRVSQGDLVDGLGRITAIERRGDKWVVITPSGLIVSN